MHQNCILMPRIHNTLFNEGASVRSCVNLFVIRNQAGSKSTARSAQPRKNERQPIHACIERISDNTERIWGKCYGTPTLGHNFT